MSTGQTLSKNLVWLWWPCLLVSGGGNTTAAPLRPSVRPLVENAVSGQTSVMPIPFTREWPTLVSQNGLSSAGVSRVATFYKTPIQVPRLLQKQAPSAKQNKDVAVADYIPTRPLTHRPLLQESDPSGSPGQIPWYWLGGQTIAKTRSGIRVCIYHKSVQTPLDVKLD